MDSCVLLIMLVDYANGCQLDSFLIHRHAPQKGLTIEKLVGFGDSKKLKTSVRYFEYLSRCVGDIELYNTCNPILKLLKLPKWDDPEPAATTLGKSGTTQAKPIASTEETPVTETKKSTPAFSRNRGRPNRKQKQRLVRQIKAQQTRTAVYQGKVMQERARQQRAERKLARGTGSRRKIEK